MRYAIFQLLGYILDASSSNCPELFWSLEGEDVVIEFSNLTLITNLILPLCDKSYSSFMEKSNWLTAKIVFTQDVITSIILENNSGECFTSEIEEKLFDEVSDFGQDTIYCRICSEIIKYATFVLTT